MSVYHPTYKDPKTGKSKESAQWWYEFSFAGRRFREPAKTTRKTIAIEAEKKRRAELEKSYNGLEDKRAERIRTMAEVAEAYFENYKLRHKSTKFAEYALGHIKRVIGKTLTADMSDAAVKDYQTARLKEKASPKSINEEVGFLLRILEERGDAIRAKMRRLKTLRLRAPKSIAKAFGLEQKAALLAAAQGRRSPSIFPALMLALHAGMRDAELKGLRWAQIDFQDAIVTVGESKTEAGEGRTIPLNSDVQGALVAHAKWYLDKFGETRPEWYVFPFGKPQPTDPKRGVTTFKTVWRLILKECGIAGRWHDNRHTFVTDLAESGAGDQTIMDMAGHVSRDMLKHYSHIRMKAKREAVAALVAKKPTAKDGSTAVSVEPPQESPKVEFLN